jgi:Synergist-CTERM protein sorting domain-containing protein
MMRNKKLLLAVCLFGVFAFAGYAASDAMWNWMEYDKPTVGHYMFQNGGSARADIYTQHFQITEEIWNKLKILPSFSEKKLPGRGARPQWSVTSGDWEYNQANVIKFVATNQELRAFWRDLANTSTGKQRMAIKELGEFPVGFPLALLIFTKTSNNKPVTEPEELRALGKPIVWLQGPIHGGEQDAGDGVAWEAYSLAMGDWDHYLDKVSIILCPRINQDGAMMMTRGSNIRDDKAIWRSPSGSSAGNNIWNVVTNIDMNRDNLWFDMPSLRAVHTAFNAYFPEVAGDHHTWGDSRNYFGGFVEDTSLPSIDGRPQLLVSRDAAGKPILAANGSLINLAPAQPEQATLGVGGGTNLYTTWEIGIQHGDHLNNPRDFQNYWIDKMEPYVMKFMKDRGVGSHHYIDGVIGALDPTRFGPYHTGTLSDNPAHTYNEGNIPDGTGIPGGGNEGAMFDPAHMFNALPLKPCLSALLESRSSGLIDYPKRVYSSYTAGESMIAFTAENATEVKNFVAEVRNKISERGKKVYTGTDADPEDTVYNLMKMVKRTVTSEDWVTNDGSKISLPTAFWNTREPEPQVYRVRPTAYILPYSEMSVEISKRLIFNGAQVEVLNVATTMEVEVFATPAPMASKRYHDNSRRIVIAPSDSDRNNTSYIRDPKLVQWSPNFWIQDQPNTLTTQTVTVPKGSFVVYMSQPTARMIATVMEADAERSYTRWSLAREIQALDTRGVCVPYRYMKEQRLDTKPLFMAWPQALGAGMMEVEPLSGVALEELAASSTFSNKKILVAETLYAKIDSPVKMGFSFLSREELRKGMPDANFYFWNYNTDKYEVVKRNADGTVYVGEEYWGPHGDYGIQPIMFVATTGGGLINDLKSGGGCNAGYALYALLLLVPVLRRRG